MAIGATARPEGLGGRPDIMRQRPRIGIGGGIFTGLQDPFLETIDFARRDKNRVALGRLRRKRFQRLLNLPVRQRFAVIWIARGVVRWRAAARPSRFWPPRQAAVGDEIGAVEARPITRPNHLERADLAILAAQKHRLDDHRRGVFSAFGRRQAEFVRQRGVERSAASDCGNGPEWQAVQVSFSR